MSESYTVGGDSTRQLIRDRESGQTFRVITPFTLRWVDLTMKLLKRNVPPLIRLYYADIYHEPTMNPISWQTGWTLETPVSRPDWLWNEPWGQSLSQNHHWTILADPNPPDIKLQIGILTLTFTHTPHSGLIWSAPVNQIPLRDPGGQPLRICTNNVTFSSWNPFDNITNMVAFRKNGTFLSLYLIIKGSIVGWGSGDYGFEANPPLYNAWKYIGKGIHDVDLLDFFYQAAPDLGLDPDPTGWFVDAVEIAHRDPTPLLTSYLENDFIRLHHSHTPIYDPPIPGKDEFISGNIYRVRFPMKPITLDPDQYYALMVYSFEYDAANAPSWLYDKDDAQYPRGHRIWRDHSADPWTHQYSDDHLFIVFGDPPAIPPPPEPPIEKFIPTQLTQTPTLDGFKIEMATNVPCHLTLYWTATEPLKHPLSRVRRGIDVPWYTRYCFVNYHANEQEEAGDTLYHTFIKPDWPICETRWFTIRGNIDENLSPSVGPIFKKHRVPVLLNINTELVTVGISNRQEYSFPLLPIMDYKINQATLRFTGHEWLPPADFIVFRLWEATTSGEPTGEPLVQDTKPSDHIIYQPGASTPITFNFPQITLKKGKWYAHSGAMHPFSGDYWDYSTGVIRGADGPNDQPPIFYHREITNGVWGAWTYLAVLPAHYIMHS